MSDLEGVTCKQKKARPAKPLMSAHHGTEGNQTNQRVWGDQTQTDDQSVPQCLQILFIQTRIDHEKKNGWNRCWAGEGVFDSRVLREEFRGQICVRDVLVMRRESVSRQAERTNPELSSDVYLTENKIR